MKAIMISIKPKWVAKILNGDKTVEARTSKALYKATQKLIDEYGYAEFYAYCTKGKQGIFKERHNGYTLLNQNKWIQSEMNGKVIFKFRCYKVEEIKFIMDYIYGGYYNTNSYTNEKCFERDCCLTVKELDNYINKNNLNKRDNVAYALHISNLKIFDKPKELSEFWHYKGGFLGLPNPKTRMVSNITKAPQSFCYIEIEE